ncbi:adenylate cyclase [Marinobacterium nitratireducens]|uniref:Adenylate cyclase n=1 Tax=Marinobacterium nitratireducens TaxID=518897 RepID=A0A917ZA29_9GAMM|nr:adenylate/guanylate cyclase domain-containing protein [Marinobacterium nitratireducens]GGO79288.1 adenylate cyclase [Marinobacterium nitratireducens]
MKFFKMLAEVSWLLRHRKLISYEALRQEYELDDAGLEALRIELIQVERVAIDLDGRFLACSDLESTKLPAGPECQTARPPVTEEKVVAPVTDRPAPPGSAASDAERRHLTVMFCDLVGSTELSTRLDPEDLQDIIRAYQEAAARVIRDFSGFIAKYMGDGILVYFGYPQASERSAEAAIKTALGIVQTMPLLNDEFGRSQGIEIAVRIGIATGLVVVGEITGEGEAQERSVVGETPNLAARLQALAQKNGIVISKACKELAGERFVFQALGEQRLKGIAGAVEAWGVTGESVADVQPQSAPIKPRLPLVGRQEEVGLLTRAWEGSREGRGQVVLIQGEAGIGKSRLLQALRDHAGGIDYTWVAVRASPYHTASTLYPIIEQLKRAMRWQPDDSAQTRFQKLEKFLQAQHSWPLEESVPLFAAMLSLPLIDARYAQLQMSSQQQREATLDAATACYLELAELRPILMVWEDLHWADPTTVELLGLLIAQVPTVPMLLVATYRPEFVAPWPVRSHITPITLNRLARAEVEAIVTHLAGNKTMPKEVLDHIVTKADGVPLYVEELTHTILQSEILVEAADHYELNGVLADMHIPETLQDSLMARLDRTPIVREIAQLAAVLGREFSYDMLASLAPHGEQALQQGLAQLVENDLLYQRGRGQRALYQFKHMLIQEAAYQSLLKRSRQKYHRQAAQLLEQRFREVIEAHPEVAAHHLTEAGDTRQAIGYWQQAGEKAERISAHQEVISHLSKALELLPRLPDDPERARLELDLLISIGPSLGTVRGYAASEYGRTYSRARDLCARLGDSAPISPVLRALAVHHLVRGETDIAVATSDAFLKIAAQQQDEAAEMFGHYSLGISLLFTGSLAPARAQLVEALQRYDPDRHQALVHTYNIDIGVGAQGFEALGLWLLGFADQALEKAATALALAQRHQHPFSLAFAWLWKAKVHQYRGEREAAIEHAKRGSEIAREHGMSLLAHHGKTILGWALALDDAPAQGAEKIRESLAEAARAGSRNFAACDTAMLAEAQIACGQITLARKTLQEALARETEEQFWVPELHRLLGELELRAGSDLGQAEAALRQALRLAQAQGARALELRAALSLARLLQQQTRPDQARKLLAPVYDGFTEGFDTADLRAARGFLDKLAACRS